jgi:hypothetical protein
MIAVGVRKFYASNPATERAAPPRTILASASVLEQQDVERFARHLSAVLDPARLAGRASQRAARRHSNVRGDSNEVL